MNANQARFAVHTVCRVLDVSASGFYAWQGRAPSRHATQDAVLTERIRLLHAASDEIYGSPNIHAELRDEGTRVGRKRVARPMRTRSPSLENQLINRPRERGNSSSTASRRLPTKPPASPCSCAEKARRREGEKARRREGETLNQLIKRLDKAIQLAWTDDLFVDEVNDGQSDRL